MILLAGLVVAGLVGIAAAFYFSVRPGSSRARAAEPDGTSADRQPGGWPTEPRDEPQRPAAAQRTRHAASRAPARTADLPAEPGPLLQAPTVLAPPAPAVTVPAMDVHAMNETPGLLKRESQPAGLLADPADADGAAKAPRSRRRVGWRKGAEVDEELWPAEAFGGVTDEQFWDDLAADKPLATTARTAQPESGARSHPESGSRGRPDSGSTRRPPGAVPYPDGRVSSRSDWTATQPAPIAARATHAARPPVDEEDPLTSPAYSLRPRGAVDGRSFEPSRRSRDLSREQYEAAISQSTQTFSSADIQAATGGYPGGVPSLRESELPAHAGNGAHLTRSGGYRSDPLRSDGYRSGPAGSPAPVRTIPTPGYQPSLASADAGTGAYPYPEPSSAGPMQSMNTPPYGERYGYGNPVGLAGGPRQPNGAWGYGQPGGGGAGDGNLRSRYAYPPAGYRGPYDPRGNDRR